MTTKTFTIGERVAFSLAFIRSTHAANLAGQRGHVTHVSPFAKGRDLVQVQWDDGHVSKSLNVNLRRA